MYYHDPLDPDTIRTDDEARDDASERYEARLAAGEARPPVRATSLPEPRAHCLTFRVEISAELPSPVMDTVTLARETSYDGHRAEPLRIMQALEPLVLSLLALMQGLPGNVADTEETAGSLTVTIGSPRARGEVARRFSFATTLKGERGDRGEWPIGRVPVTIRQQFSACIHRACRDYDLLCADEFPAEPEIVQRQLPPWHVGTAQQHQAFMTSVAQGTKNMDDWDAEKGRPVSPSTPADTTPACC